jgi:hypothetical protein
MYIRNTALKCGRDLLGLGFGPVAASTEHVNEQFGSIKGGKFSDQLTMSLFLKNNSKNSTLWST